ncbi:MAG: CoA transferase [Dehalococcoidia bacterium]|nr:MAG: CoA transferase [Dehalococcoidia bacterium]
MERRPFEGVNVLDFTWAGVGPHTVNYLAHYGATAIKVESQIRPDVLRSLGPFKDGIPGLERSYYFTFVQSAKKYDITLNLEHPKGIELAKRLIAWADIVVESFATGAMERWGLDYENLKSMKPDIIMLRTCMHGHTGPLAKHHGQGFVLTALSGIDAITGWPDRPPAGLYDAFTDLICPLYNIASLIAALDYRRRTGKGQYIDQAQQEAVIQWIAPLILDYTVNGREPSANGNRLAYAAPHGIYRCQGDDRWCAIAVFTDDEWESFCGVILNPTLVKDPKFATLLSRKQNEDELDRLVEEWTIKHSPEEVMNLMQAAGVAAGVVANAKDQAEDPQLKHYHFAHELDHPEMGKVSIYHGPYVRLSKTTYEVGRAPLLGEHNEYVYTKLLGIPDEEWAQLMAEGVI